MRGLSTHKQGHTSIDRQTLLSIKLIDHTWRSLTLHEYYL